MGEDLPCYSNKMQPVSLSKCQYHHLPTDKAYLSDSRVTNVSTIWRQKSATYGTNYVTVTCAIKIQYGGGQQLDNGRINVDKNWYGDGD